MATNRVAKVLAAVLMSLGLLAVAPAGASASPKPVQCWELEHADDSNATVKLWRCLHDGAVIPIYHGQIINGITGDTVLVRRGNFNVVASASIPNGATSADTRDVDGEQPYQVCFRRGVTVGECTGFWS
jgi:hypothetical protein